MKAMLAHFSDCTMSENGAEKLGSHASTGVREHGKRNSDQLPPRRLFRKDARGLLTTRRSDVVNRQRSAMRSPFAFSQLSRHTARMHEPSSIAVVGEFPTVYRTWLWRNVIIASWFGHPASAPAVLHLATITEQVLERLGPGRVSYVHLVPSGLALPDAQTRAAFLEITHKHAANTACVAVVIAGSGFWASAMRSFVTGFRMLAPRLFALRISAAVPELLPWFPEEHARFTGVQLDGDELVRQVEYALARGSSPE
jgi:hypothetical protein